jgi:hypothetical protein
MKHSKPVECGIDVRASFAPRHARRTWTGSRKRALLDEAKELVRNRYPWRRGWTQRDARYRRKLELRFARWLSWKDQRSHVGQFEVAVDLLESKGLLEAASVLRQFVHKPEAFNDDDVPFGAGPAIASPAPAIDARGVLYINGKATAEIKDVRVRFTSDGDE